MKSKNGQFWMEASIATNDDDKILEVTAGPYDYNANTDGFKVTIKSCDIKDPKIYTELWLTPRELDSVAKMFAAVRKHHNTMAKYEKGDKDEN